MGVRQSIRQRKPVAYPTRKLCEEVVGGFLAYRGRDSSPATWRVFAGGTNQAFLDKHRFDASGLQTSPLNVRRIGGVTMAENHISTRPTLARKPHSYKVDEGLVVRFRCHANSTHV